MAISVGCSSRYADWDGEKLADEMMWIKALAGLDSHSNSLLRVVRSDNIISEYDYISVENWYKLQIIYDAIIECYNCWNIYNAIKYDYISVENWYKLRII